MNFLTLLSGALATQYIVYVLVDSTLLDQVRPSLMRLPFLRSVLRCTHCASFWAALLVLLLTLNIYTFWLVWLCAFAGGGQLLAVARERMDR